MFDSKLIEVVISLTFFFILLSFICSAAVELIELYVKQRAQFQYRGIYELAGPNSEEFVRRLYSHALISSLYRGTYNQSASGFMKNRNLPSYIPAQNFALALIDLKNSGAVLPQRVKEALHSFQIIAEQDVVLLEECIEHWYLTTMDRVTGWYKRRTQLMVFGLGLFIAIAINADCIDIVMRLSAQANFRELVLHRAETAINSNQSTDSRNPSDRLESDMRILEKVSFPLGWSDLPEIRFWGMVKRHGVGWLLTALIVSLVAPAWFDTLNRFMIIRATCKPSYGFRVEAPRQMRPPMVVAAPAPIQVQSGPPDSESEE